MARPAEFQDGSGFLIAGLAVVTIVVGSLTLTGVAPRSLVALLAPVTLGAGIAYPLSRRPHAEVSFRGGVVDAALFLCVLGPCLFALGHLMGWIVGYEPRFDFMPFFLRVLPVTVILMPLAHRGRPSLTAASGRRAGNSQAWMVFAIIGFGVRGRREGSSLLVHIGVRGQVC